jgi:DNA (cytosine-5)-methyltransferase 1
VIRFLSLFSGIEAASVAWHKLGWECAGVSEIEPFACAALAHHYPDVPNLGDVTAITEAQVRALGRLDVLVFGSPCQDLSVAGKGAGLEGQRSGLFHDAIRIVRWARQHCGLRFALWENVPGAFSSNSGRDFAVVLACLTGLAGIKRPPRGWGTEGAAVGPEGMVEWATLDAQWFGLAQRRERVFALADFGDWTSRGPVLLEPDSMRGHPPARRGPGETVTGTLTRSAIDGSGAGGGDGRDSFMIAQPFEVAHTLRVEGFDASEDGTGRGTPLVPEVASTLTVGGHSYPGTTGESAGGQLVPIAFNCRQDPDVSGDIAGPVDAGRPQQQAIAIGTGVMRVRRLTPRECERLQGFADDYTLVPFTHGRPAKDGPRYKALGNSMAVRVMFWIGQRIAAVLA